MFCLTLADKKSHEGGKKLQKNGTFFQISAFFRKNQGISLSLCSPYPDLLMSFSVYPLIVVAFIFAILLMVASTELCRGT